MRSLICIEKLFQIVCMLIICCAPCVCAAEAEMSWDQLNKAIDKNPNDAKLWLMRGHILAKTFEDQEAIDNYTKSIKLDPKVARAYVLRGDSYFSFQKLGDALIDYLKAQSMLKAQGDSNSTLFVDLQNSLARCYKSLKQYDKELPLRIAVAKNTVVIPDLTNLAECQIANHLPKEASSTYKRAIELDPTRLKLYRQYGDAVMATGDYAGAAKIYGDGIQRLGTKRGFDLNNDYVLYDRRAACYEKLGKSDLAVKDRRHSQRFNENLLDTIPTFDPRNKR